MYIWDIDFQMVSKRGNKVIAVPEIGEVTLRKSIRARRISLRVHPLKGVTVSIPYFLPYAAGEAFLRLKHGWITETMARQREKMKDVHIPAPDEIEGLRSKARAELPARLELMASRYGFSYNRVTIKHNATNWGSCSSKGNINLNLNIVRLPEVLQDYILLHELCHLRHHDHGHAFHLLLEHVLTDNLMRLIGDSPEAALASGLASKAAASKARYPLDYTMTRAIRKYRLV